MTTILVFAGERFYPGGGALDLKCTLTNRELPSIAELGRLFQEIAAEEEWIDNDYWMNILVVAANGKSQTYHWKAYIRTLQDNTDEWQTTPETYYETTARLKFHLVPVVMG